MPYPFGTKNGPSLGKTCPGLPTPSRYDTTVNTAVNVVPSALKTFINDSYQAAAAADWSSLTTGATPGSASGTVSPVINVTNTTGMRVGGTDSHFSGALKVSDNFFVALTTEVADVRRTNLTLFDVSTGVNAVTTIGISSGSTQSQPATLVPSSDPKQFLATWRNYETSYQEFELYRADPNAGMLTVGRTGTKTNATGLTIAASEQGLPWHINPLGNINGKETWIATNYTGTGFFITYDGATGSMNLVAASLPYTVAFLQKVQEDSINAYLMGVNHPYAGGLSISAQAVSIASIATLKLTKSTSAWTRLTDASTNKFGCSGVFNNTPDYYHGGFRSYGCNGSGFLLSYRGSYTTADGKPSYSQVISPPTTSALTYLDANGIQRVSMVSPSTTNGVVSMSSLTPIGPTAIAARGSTTDFFGGSAHHENTNTTGFTYLNIAYLTTDGVLASKSVSLSFLPVEANSMQIVPFGDKFLVLAKGNNSNNAQAVWVYPR